MKAIGSDMRPGVVSDLRRRTARHEFIEDRRFEWVIHPSVDLAVRVGAGAALTKEQIRLGVEFALAEEARQGTAPLPERRPAIDHVDPDPAACQGQGGQQARRPAPHHHHPGALE